MPLSRTNANADTTPPQAMPLYLRILNHNLQEEAVEAPDSRGRRTSFGNGRLRRSSWSSHGPTTAEAKTQEGVCRAKQEPVVSDLQAQLATLRAELDAAKEEAENKRLLALKLKEDNDYLRSELDSHNGKMTDMLAQMKQRDDELAELKAQAENSSTERDLLRANNLRLVHERDEAQQKLSALSNTAPSEGFTKSSLPHRGPSPSSRNRTLQRSRPPSKKQNSLRDFLGKRTSSKFTHSSRSVSSMPTTTPLGNNDDIAQEKSDEDEGYNSDEACREGNDTSSVYSAPVLPRRASGVVAGRRNKSINMPPAFHSQPTVPAYRSPSAARGGHIPQGSMGHGGGEDMNLDQFRRHR